MNAKDRLRRYLEQRRELGESELVLDALSVEDAMKLLGATSPVAAPPRADKRSTQIDRIGNSAASGEPVVAPSPPTVLPVPDVRFDVSHSTDWRQTLRASEAATGASRLTPSEATEAQVPANDPAKGLETTGPAPWLTALGLPRGLVVASLDQSESGIARLESLADVAESARTCTQCGLHTSARHVVPGEGNPTADFVCVGEAPGANEDELGRPFVGDAGLLLTKILGAIQLRREDVFICNVLKHRPPMNRDPLPEEVVACQPYLIRQLQLIRPRVILALGRFAAQTLLRTSTPIGQLRGQLHSFYGIPLIVTYHPAALLRNEAWKRPTWDDVKLARRVLDASRDAQAPDDDSR